MRKILFIALFGLLIIFSCKKDDDTPTTDCFDCTVQTVTSTFCYTEGEDHYTLTLSGVDTDVLLNGQSWITIKAALQIPCE